jgi:hypothetical protein
VAKINNTFVTADAKGIREDLSDLIEDISPEDTPYYSNAGRGGMKQTFHEWQTDALAAAISTNALPEGDDVSTFTAVTPTVRIGAHAQIARKEFLISGTEEIVDKAGRKSEIAYQLSKKSAELKRDIEKALLENIADSGSDPRVTPGRLAYLKTNVDFETGGGVNPVWTTVPNDVRTDGTPRTFTETMLKTVIASAYANGASPDTVMVGPFNKQVVSTFVGIADRVYNLNKPMTAAIIGAADVYVSDFGTLSVVPNRFQRERDAHVIDFDFVKVRFLRQFKTEKLAKTGDAEKRMILAEYMHQITEEKSQALVADLTSS